MLTPETWNVATNFRKMRVKKDFQLSSEKGSLTPMISQVRTKKDSQFQIPTTENRFFNYQNEFAATDFQQKIGLFQPLKKKKCDSG